MLRYIIILWCVLAISACAAQDKTSVNWNSIDFKNYACAGKSSNPGCKSNDDNGIASAGRGKGK